MIKYETTLFLSCVVSTQRCATSTSIIGGSMANWPPKRTWAFRLHFLLKLLSNGSHPHKNLLKNVIKTSCYL